MLFRFLSSLSQSEAIRIQHRLWPSLLCIWIWSVLVCVQMIGARTQIDDIIIDVNEPENSVDDVVILELEEDEQNRRQVETEAMCRARCMDHSEVLKEDSDQSGEFEKCLKDHSCITCSIPCSERFLNLSHCERLCEYENSGSCRDSCSFLESISSQRTDQCPGSDQLAGHAAPCTEACLVDSDCPQTHHKCCHTGCGHVCAEPELDRRGVPPVPSEPWLSELPLEGGVMLQWNNVSTTGHVIYIVWVRWNVGKHHSLAHVTPWEHIVQTTDTSTVIKAIRPGHWYQYKVSAVNVNGSSDASPSSKAFCLSQEPGPPDAPFNLTEGDTVVHGDHVTVSIQWDHPMKSDLPISKYKIFWSKRQGEELDMLDAATTEHKHVIHGDQNIFEVPKLDPDTTYLIEVQAICQYGDTRLKSDRAFLYITTLKLPQVQMLTRTTYSTPLVTEWLQTPSPLTTLHVTSPFFVDGLVMANISWSIEQDMNSGVLQQAFIQWSPDACIADSLVDEDLSHERIATAEGQHYTLSELKFDCRYVVHVSPISTLGAVGKETRISFVTPSCGEVVVIGPDSPNCPSKVARVPNSPTNLQHRFTINSLNISAYLTWDPPLSDSPVIGYRVTWGQTLPQQPNVWDKNNVLTKVLDKMARSFELHSLCEVSTYLVRIQALSKVGPGQVAMSRFTAPRLSSWSSTASSSSVLTSYHILDKSQNGHLGKFSVTSNPDTRRHNSAFVWCGPCIALKVVCVIIHLSHFVLFT